MEGLAKRLNLTIPSYVPISPFKDIDAPLVTIDSVRYETSDCVHYEKRKLNKDLNPQVSSNGQTTGNLKVEKVSEAVDLCSGIKTSESLKTNEDTQSDLKSSAGLNGRYSGTQNDTFPVQCEKYDCSEIQHKKGEQLDKDESLKRPSENGVDCVAMPSKKVKDSPDMAFA